MPVAQSLAEKFGSAVTLVRAITPAEELITDMSANGMAMAPTIDPTPIVAAEWQDAPSYLYTIAQSWSHRGLGDIHCEMPKGRAAADILELGRELPADLIAMTTHGRGGLGWLVYGSVADQVFQDAMKSARADWGSWFIVTSNKPRADN